MAKIIFDEESKVFSVVEDQHEYGAKDAVTNVAKAVGKHIGKNSRAYITGSSTLAGSGVGAIVAKKRAEKRALAAGATPEEAKKAGRRAMIKGAAAGAAIGAVAGEAGQFGTKTVKGALDKSQPRNWDLDSSGNMKKAGILKRLGRSAKSAGSSMYVDPAVKAKDAIKNKFKKSK